MTIIHISSSFGGGGADQMVLQLAKKSTPHFKTIAFSVSKANTLEPQFKDAEIEYYFLNVTSFKNKSLISGIKKLREVTKSFDDVVFHTHQYHSFLIGFFHNLLFKSYPIVFTLHSSTVESLARRLVLFFLRPFRKNDIIFSDNAEKWFLRKGTIIPNGVDFEKLSIKTTRAYTNSEPFSFLFLGRLSDEKNPLFMIEAAKRLLDDGISDFVFDVVGKGHQEEELKNRISSEGLEAHFNLLGFKSDIRPYLKSAHCLILPSKWEGMPMVLIEAAAAKLPIIATPVGSVPDFLNNLNAYVEELPNFHTAMISCIKNYDKAIQKTELLYQQANSKYDIKSVYETHLRLYRSLT